MRDELRQVIDRNRWRQPRAYPKPYDPAVGQNAGDGLDSPPGRLAVHIFPRAPLVEVDPGIVRHGPIPHSSSKGDLVNRSDKKNQAVVLSFSLASPTPAMTASTSMMPFSFIRGVSSRGRLAPPAGCSS